MTVGAHPAGLIGRDAELSRLDGFVRDVVRGQGRAVWIEGEPGIGKSALLAAGLRAAEAAGCQVFRSTAHELGQRFSLRVLLEALDVTEDSDDPQRTDIAATLRSHTSSVAVSDPVAIAAEGILALVDRLCAAGPVVLVVDDMQWADEASMAVWDRLARALDQLPLLLVAASRPPDRRATAAVGLRRSLAALDAAILTLGPLAKSESADLVALLVGAGPGGRLRRLADRAGGNPLYLREIVDAIRRDQHLHIDHGVAEINGRNSDAPPTLAAAIADRLGFLSPDAADVLRIAAILGPEFTVTDLATITGRTVTGLLPVVEEGLATGVLAEVGVRMSFRHALIRQSLAESIPAGVRTALHLQAARALVEARASLEHVAEQLLGAAGTGALTDGWVVDWLVEAGPRLVHRAPELAADMLERAVDELPRDNPHWFTLSYQQLTAAWLAGRDGDVERRARDLLAHTRDPALRPQVSWALAYVLGRMSRNDESIAVTEEALADPELDDMWSARLQAIQAIVLAIQWRYDEASAAGEAALALGQKVGDATACGYALHALSQVHLRNHDTEASFDPIDRALRTIGDSPDTADLRLILLLQWAYMLEYADRLDEAVASARDAVRIADQIGSRSRRRALSTALAEILFRAGQWDDAVAELGTPESHRVLGRGIIALVAAHRNDEAAAERAERGVSVDDAFNAQFLRSARAIAAERVGDVRRAAEILAEMLEPEVRAESMLRMYWVPDLVRSALAAGDAALARSAVEQTPYDGTVPPQRARVATEQHSRGLLDDDPDVLLAAAEMYGAIGRRLERAGALEDAAVAQARHGDTGSARTTLDMALAIYGDLGAEFDIRRAVARTRAHGLRRGQSGPRRRTTFGWAALTPTELQVALLVAQGKSNPDIGAAMFLSRRTVQTHVSHILNKLGAKSRVEIATHATRHGSESGSIAAER